jgi:putative addiction module component (TIGR02574 family)
MMITASSFGFVTNPSSLPSPSNESTGYRIAVDGQKFLNPFLLGENVEVVETALPDRWRNRPGDGNPRSRLTRRCSLRPALEWAREVVMAEMTPQVSEVLEKALALSTQERGLLIDHLIESLDEGPAEEGVEEAWDEEIKRRVDDIRSGKVEMISGEDVRRRLAARLLNVGKYGGK